MLDTLITSAAGGDPMPLKLDCVGSTTDEFVFEYTWKDVVLYALGVGATDEELDLVYEGRGPKVLPSFAVVPTYPVVDFLMKRVEGNPLGIVHSAQSVAVEGALPPNGQFRTVGKVEGIYDYKRFAQVVFSTESKDAGGKIIARSVWTLLYRFDGGFGGALPPKVREPKVPDRAPDALVEQTIAPTQALLYRLCGDRNPLHADPAVAEKAGFSRPILHGLATFGYVARAVVRSMCDGEPTKLKELRGQFRKPVCPGETLRTELWREDGLVLTRVATRERPEEYLFASGVAVTA